MKLKPFDIASVLVVILLAVLSALPMLAKDSGALVKIVTDSETYTLPLSDNTVHTFTSNSHTLTLEINNGAAKITAHTCPDGLCAAMGEISNSGQTIVCLPAKAIIRVTGAGEVLDGIAG